MNFIGEIFIILLFTTIASYLSQKVQVPAVVGQILVGILLGKGGLNWVQSSHSLDDFAEIGVVLLMFLAGIESDIGLLKKYFKPAMAVAVLGIIFPIAMGYYYSISAGVSHNESIFIGLIFAATSVSISVEVLKELNQIKSKEGSVILGASVFDDVLVVIIFSLSLPYLTNGTSSGSNGMQIIVGQLLYFAFIYVVIKWLAPYLINLAEKINVHASVVIMSLLICFGMAYLADLVGLSSVIGAFFAGIAVGQTSVKETVWKNIDVLGYSIFIPVFFVSIGLNVSFSNFGNEYGFIFWLTIIAIVSKLFGGYLGAKITGFSNNSSLMIGSGMVSRGEMALIILQIGNQAHVIENQYYSPLVIVIILTTLISPLLLKFFTKRIY